MTNNKLVYKAQSDCRMDLTLFCSFWARHFPSELPNPNFEMTIQLLLSSCHFKRKKNKIKIKIKQHIPKIFLRHFFSILALWIF